MLSGIQSRSCWCSGAALEPDGGLAARAARGRGRAGRRRRRAGGGPYPARPDRAAARAPIGRGRPVGLGVEGPDGAGRGARRDRRRRLRRLVARRRRCRVASARPPARAGRARRGAARHARHRRREPGGTGHAAPGMAGGAHAHAGAAGRRDRHRQGGDGGAGPPLVVAHRPLRADQLRRHPQRADGVGAVRPRPRRLLGRGGQRRRQADGGPRRNGVPRRDRRHAAVDAGEAAPRPRGRPGDAARRDDGAARRLPHRRRHQPRPADADRRKAASARTSTSAWPSSPSGCRGCASGSTTSRRWLGTSSAASTRGPGWRRR